MIIGIDVDSTVCNTTESVIAQHYVDTGEKLTLDDIKSYYIENYVSDDYKDDFHLIFFIKDIAYFDYALLCLCLFQYCFKLSLIFIIAIA